MYKCSKVHRLGAPWKNNIEDWLLRWRVDNTYFNEWRSEITDKIYNKNDEIYSKLEWGKTTNKYLDFEFNMTDVWKWKEFDLWNGFKVRVSSLAMGDLLPYIAIEFNKKIVDLNWKMKDLYDLYIKTKIVIEKLWDNNLSYLSDISAIKDEVFVYPSHFGKTIKQTIDFDKIASEILKS